uniref:Uncharacterized protein n=1 Tax=Aegilops tauschii subsp. strangulata TaxID=200361 RepID=A0A452YC37_AEGTS
KESCVQRNCMYLQSLGAQYAAYQLSNLEGSSSLIGPSNIHPYVLPASSLYALQFPTLSGQHSVKTRVTGGFNSELAGQMLFIAANWVMEQSTKSDLDLYGIWFKWYNGLLQPYCSFFENYGNILKQESEHPVWHSILECYGEITAYHKVDAAHPIPLLSTRLLDMGGCDTLKTCQKRLHKALNGLNLLRLTLWQWQSETVLPDFGVLKAALLPALKSLRCLEDEVLKLIVSSRKLLQIYTRILDYHRSIWKMIVSSQFEGLPVVWNLLRKEILKLQPKFPEVVGIFLMESVNLNNLQDFNSQNSKPTLWIHGGHPLVPSSGRVFYKFQEIVAFSAAVWPCKNLSKKQLDDKQQIIDAMLSANQDLRCLALEGVYIAFRAVSKPEEEESTVLAQLDEIHKSLVRKVEYERNNLGLLLKTSNAEVKVCCSVSSDILCNTCGFNGWLASLPLLNLKSLNLDTALLQCLSKWIQIDSSQIRQVRHECEELTGSNLAGDCHDQKLMQELKTEEKNLRSKVVFRPRQSKHKSLIAACCEFEGRLSDCKDLVSHLNCNGAGQLEVNRICNWQITSRNFIKRLTEEYGEYVDLIQPAQVAVYEMKLGLTIALSGSLEREYLKKVKEDDIEKVLGAVFTFMQFPNGHVAGMTVVGVPDLTNYSMGDQLETQYSEFKDVDILEKLSCVSSQLNVGEVADEVRSHSQMLVTFHHVSLVR